jgi:hypothetical protein
MATEAMNESWRRIVSQIRALWSDYEFEDADFKKARGNLVKMVDLIQSQTGESRGDITQKISAFL